MIAVLLFGSPAVGTVAWQERLATGDAVARFGRIGAAAPTPTPTAVATRPCTGDCDRDGSVSVAELIRMLGCMLHLRAPFACEASPCMVTNVGEMIAAVHSALYGCD